MICSSLSLIKLIWCLLHTTACCRFPFHLLYFLLCFLLIYANCLSIIGNTEYSSCINSLSSGNELASQLTVESKYSFIFPWNMRLMNRNVESVCTRFQLIVSYLWVIIPVYKSWNGLKVVYIFVQNNIYTWCWMPRFNSTCCLIIEYSYRHFCGHVDW